MGNCWCCRSESPCGTVEERSGLLNDDSKATVCTGSKAVVGSCGPEGSDKREKKDEKDKQLKPSPENREPAPKNTQENGPLKKESIQTVMLSPCRVSEGNATRAQQIKETPAQRGQDELTLQSTSGSLQKDFTKVDWVVFDRSNTEGEYPALVQDKIPDVTPVIPEVLCPHTDTEATEHITMRTTHHDAEEEEKVTSEAVTKPSGEFSQNNKVVSVPNTHLTAVPDQVSSISGVNQEPKPESPTCAVSEVPDNNREAGPEVLQSHDVFQSSSGLEPSGLGHSGEEWDCASSLREPETTAPADASESLESDPDKMPDPECTTLLEEEVTSLEKTKQEAEEEVMLKVQDKDVPKAKEEDNGIKEEKAEAESGLSETKTGAGKDAETEEVTGEGAQLSETTAKDVEAEDTEKEDNLENSEEDLYRGEEELSASQSNKPGPPPELETKFLKVEDRCSLSPAVNILSYSEREWKGNTAKSALIKKGYKEMSQRFDSVRRVRGDNYCALRATLFQVLSHSTQLPAWLKDEDIIMLPKQLEAQEGLISEWTFPGECLQGDGTGDTIQQLKGYMELLCNTWQEAVDCASNTERQQLCERVFQGGEEELGLLEALKLLMLSRAVELHSCMRDGGDVPLFCWLLFARDSSDCPRSFLSNHLNHVGLTAGLEQVEMFLLGYALQCTIQVYRLYKADTEEFVTYYPDDHKDDWQSVCLVTEDDRHYNVPVVEAAEIQKELPSS